MSKSKNDNIRIAEKIKILIYGMFMGFADIIPGISGATIALILGIYEKLITSFDYVFKHIFSKKLFSKELVFLVNLYLGVGIGMIIFGRIILHMLENFKNITYAYFIGLIIASIFHVKYKERIALNKASNFIAIFLGILFGIILLSQRLANLNHNPITLFFSGFLAISAMLLPGISGSYVLVMLNQYEFILKSLKELNPIVLYFILGVILGLASMARIIKWLIEHFREITISFLIGIMIAGLKIPANYLKHQPLELISLILGIITVLILERISTKRKPKQKNKTKI